ncbi:MAG: transposase [Clostridia bacterium]|nr:transposase [Clostridia bacterium]MBN2883100.1 transposase [Clostridia bacterium]
MGDIREKSPLNIYHVFNRGNNRENILKTNEEKELYLFYFNDYIKPTSIKVHCSSLMTNHSHKILEGPLPEISRFMKLFQSKFAKHYNMWHDRTGHVFEGPFGSNPVFSSKNYTDLFRYVSLNAVKAGISNDPYSYKWCSLNQEYKLNNLASEKEIIRFFNLEGLNIDSFLKDKSDTRISCFDKMKFKLDEAKAFFNDQLIRYSIHCMADFWNSSSDVITKILKNCRYYGITIMQLQKITNLSYVFIQSCVPSEDDYI